MDYETGKRYCIKYRQENLYVIQTEKSFSLSMTDLDDQRTLCGLDIIGNLVTLLLRKGVDEELISGAVWEASRDERDLAAKLSRIITHQWGSK